LSCGCCLVLAPLLATQTRIYRIFSATQIKPLIIKDSQVALYLIVMLTPQIIINIIWSSYSPNSAVIATPDLIRPALNYTYCKLNSSGIILAYVSMSYFFVLEFILLVFAFLIRHVDDRFNEVRSILMAVYTLTFSSILIVALEVVDSSDRTSHYLFRGIALVIVFLAIESIILIPKFVVIAFKFGGATVMTSNEVPNSVLVQSNKPLGLLSLPRFATSQVKGGPNLSATQSIGTNSNGKTSQIVDGSNNFMDQNRVLLSNFQLQLRSIGITSNEQLSQAFSDQDKRIAILNTLASFCSDVSLFGNPNAAVNQPPTTTTPTTATTPTNNTTATAPVTAPATANNDNTTAIPITTTTTTTTP